MLRLVAAITFTIVIGNADAHGKNVGLLHPTPGTVELAPLYDTVPTALWQQLRQDAAMTIGGRTRLSTITPGDVVAEAATWPLSPAAARERAISTAEHVLELVQHVRLHSPVRAFVEPRTRAFLSAR